MQNKLEGNLYLLYKLTHGSKRLMKEEEEKEEGKRKRRLNKDWETWEMIGRMIGCLMKKGR